MRHRLTKRYDSSSSSSSRPAAALGRPIWGIKEVRYALPEAREIRRLFPGTRILHLVRDPRDVLRSLDVWEQAGGNWRRRDTETAVRDWLRVADSFLYVERAADPSVLRIRYEDMTGNEEEALHRIAEHCGLDPAGLDIDVFARRIHTDGPNGSQPQRLRNWSELPRSMRQLLDTDAICLVARACGYDV